MYGGGYSGGGGGGGLPTGVTQAAGKNLVVTAQAATDVPLTVQLAASQSANGVELKRDGDATAFSGINSNGFFFGTAIYGNSGGTDLLYIGASNPTVAPARVYGGAFNLTIPAYHEQSPAQITANQNNYALTYYSGAAARLSSDASRNITGIDWGQATTTTNGTGMLHKMIFNVGAQPIVLTHEDAASTAGNRFLNSTGASITLSANQAADLYYDFTTARWRVFKKT